MRAHALRPQALFRLFNISFHFTRFQTSGRISFLKTTRFELLRQILLKNYRYRLRFANKIERIEIENKFYTARNKKTEMNHRIDRRPRIWAVFFDSIGIVNNRQSAFIFGLIFASYSFIRKRVYSVSSLPPK